jgi:hypothetical protein
MSASSVKRTLTVAAIAMIASGCGGGGRSLRAPAPVFGGSSDNRALTITIENQQLNEARITLWIDGSRRRLGTVQAHSQETYRVEMNGVSNVRVEFDLTLGAHCETRQVPLSPGEVIHVIIPPNLRMMAAVCRQ